MRPTIVFLCCTGLLAQSGDWQTYGHDPGGQRFSPLTTINTSNVQSLKIAWTYRTGDAYAPPSGSRPTQFEATPLYMDGTLYLSTPLGRVIALDPIKGTASWTYDPHIDKDKGYGDFANRGVSTWKAANGRRYIYDATIDARLIALDALTGALIQGFGDNGIVDLRQSLRIPARWYADYEETSPPAVIGNTLVVGSGIADNGSSTQPSGEVRAFDAASGKLKWTWDPIPQDPKDPAYATWKNGSAAHTGAANAWSVIAADPPRDLVFVPTGSASPDYYGGERLGENMYANSVVALRASTGQVVWHFQTVHHDLWDFDVATPPLLFDIHQGSETIPAIAIGSKTANLFILNRETGKPVFGVEERPVPKSDVPGEITSPTQPFPVKPAPMSVQKISPDDAWGIDDADRAWCRDELTKVHTGPIFTPPSLTGTVTLPGNIGGMNWGGMAYDPQNDLIVLPSNNFAAEMRLLSRADYESMQDSRNRKLNGDWEFAPQRGTPYGMMRRFLLSPKHLPCNPPPWSTLTAISGSTGDVKWRVPLGSFDPRTPKEWGSVSLGGPIATAGGLVFVGSTLATELYAFDIKTGRLLWTGNLPTSPKATPMTYQAPDGKQYVIICAGGFGDKGLPPLGDYVVAFSL